ncbi:MAG: right-handed parallel beta-helix repeat-containing protein [Pseudomonadota bacterium]
MNHDALEHIVPEEGTPRRKFLKNSLLLTVPALVGGALLPKVSMAATYVPPTRMRGLTRLNVRNYGALGNGTSDDTAAIQAAINALPSDGGTVYIPAGTYMIDAVKSIRLRSKMHLELDPAAVLKAIPNGAEKAYVVLASKCTDVEISGGQIIGERYGHLVTTGEWGHAIFIRGSQRVTIRDIRVADCYGDGISLGAAPVWQSAPIYSEDVAIANVVSTNNRRQALTIGRAKYVQVHDSEFSNSNGVKPQTGIDIEPDMPDEGGIADRITIKNCVIRGNRTYGINIFKGARNITIRGCTIEENGSCGLVTVGCTGIYIAVNTVRRNSATGIFIQYDTTNCQISQNTFYDNYLRLGDVDRTAFSLYGWDKKVERDLLYRGEGIVDLRITTNYYR